MSKMLKWLLEPLKSLIAVRTLRTYTPRFIKGENFRRYTVQLLKAKTIERFQARTKLTKPS